MKQHNKLNYVEFAASDIDATKSFFSSSFGWDFVDYGAEYTSFSNQGLDGGFYKTDKASTTKNGGALLVLYSSNLQASLQQVIANGGRIVKEIFEFPGGCRFHFKEPSGNEFAVWSEQR
ncbi:VOC family protein [Thalassotalea aquiviva]|uniref:VOC family protein n=1 Tax=Thalassotalea aquiviva TaxID=3242415 RepID=UPI00352B0108